jgi:phage/conjugal plasmid C-4 type zinc finger TraR family protein
MVDQFDLAQELDARYREQALTARQRVATFAADSRTNCLDCGDKIPEARRRALPGCIRCTLCAEMFEANWRKR